MTARAAGWSYLPTAMLPSALDVVWCRFPFEEHPNLPGKARPGLVRSVGMLEENASIEIAYGTTRLRLKDAGEDFFIVAEGDLRSAGLRRATRFVLSRSLWLPWTTAWFAPPTEAHATPVIGRLSAASIVELRRVVAMRPE